MSIDERLLAVDPGETCGWALGTLQGSTYCSGQDPPRRLYEMLAGWLRAGTLDRVIIEEFRLYAGKAGAQTGSTFPTVEVVGVLKYLLDGAGVPYTMQKADVKEATANVLRSRGVKPLARGAHAKDAELHLYYYKLKGH